MNDVALSLQHGSTLVILVLVLVKSVTYLLSL